MLTDLIRRLIRYANRNGLLPEEENTYAFNQLLMLFGEDAPPEQEEADGSPMELENILNGLLNEADVRGLLTENTTTWRDLFDSRIMNCVMPRPKTVIDRFYELYGKDRQAATDWYYKFSGDSDYIRRYRIRKDLHWTVDSPYGEIEISVNLSKPEKDPKAIAMALKKSQAAYPKCQLCMENEGYAGRADHPGRANHRIVPLSLAGDEWFLQYSPYVYYNEHCILLNRKHVPMRIERATFRKLLDFVEMFPHYFLGSNADLPIVGGSILTHDHYQGGRHDFPMAKAKIARTVEFPEFPTVSAGIVNWPLTVLRLCSTDKEALIALADRIQSAWRGYSDEARMIFSETDGEPHNTVTPIARMRGGQFELDLVLRNNLTTPERPLGLYHPRPEYHHIKKENIGLIEVMGLAILPARLKAELELLADALVRGEEIDAIPELQKHAAWVREWRLMYPGLSEENVTDILRRETGRVFVHVLEDCGVYPCTEEGRDALERFLATV